MADIITNTYRLDLVFETSIGKNVTVSFFYSKDADTINGGDVSDLMDLMVEKTNNFTRTLTEPIKAEIVRTKTTALDMG